MEDSHTTSWDSPDPDAETETDEDTVAIWGVRPAKTVGAESPSGDIWGSAPTDGKESPGSDPAPLNLWGEGPTPRESRERTTGGDPPARFILPPAWAVTPKRKPGWIRRRRRA
jgi:hypothetical protein